MSFSIENKLGDLLDNDTTKAILEKHMPGISTHPQIGMGRGFPLSVVALIEVESEQPEQFDHLQATLVAHPNVQQCYYVTGEWDFVVMVTVRDMNEYIAMTREMFLRQNNVKRFRTLVVMSSAKATLDVPLQPQQSR